eukprot:Amastigsp_a175419_24.p3 type:complete len:119 gc:universal Amastigsp_a175419_24:580-224(-)
MSVEATSPCRLSANEALVTTRTPAVMRPAAAVPDCTACVKRGAMPPTSVYNVPCNNASPMPNATAAPSVTAVVPKSGIASSAVKNMTMATATRARGDTRVSPRNVDATTTRTIEAKFE